MKTLVLYHANCVDGFTSAWAAWRLFKNSADYKAVNYGEKPPDVSEYHTIYILDFSYPRDVLERWSNETHLARGEHVLVRNVYILDHHESAEEQLRDFPGAHFDITHSGAYLAWKRFQPEYEVPVLVNYVQDRDLWTWKLPYSREISAAIASYPFDFEVWDDLECWLESINYESNHHSLVLEGSAILRYQKQQIDRICNGAFIAPLTRVHRIPQVDSSVLQSEVGEELLRLYPEYPFVAVFTTYEKGIKWSLRSRGDFDVSEIAKQYGGGGHRAAAGFEEDLESEL